MSATARIRLAAVVMFLGVSLGAFGAHGLAERLAETGRADNWNTATLYLFVHGLGMFGIALTSPRALAYWFFLAGIVLFSGSLYVLALTNITKLGMITPFGGVAFLIGWAAWIFHRSSKP